jgi:hypothetical protein
MQDCRIWLAKHVALRTELFGAHEHVSHYVFDICRHDTIDIVLTA